MQGEYLWLHSLLLLFFSFPSITRAPRLLFPPSQCWPSKSSNNKVSRVSLMFWSFHLVIRASIPVVFGQSNLGMKSHPGRALYKIISLLSHLSLPAMISPWTLSFSSILHLPFAEPNASKSITIEEPIANILESTVNVPSVDPIFSQ